MISISKSNRNEKSHCNGKNTVAAITIGIDLCRGLRASKYSARTRAHELSATEFVRTSWKRYPEITSLGPKTNV